MQSLATRHGAIAHRMSLAGRGGGVVVPARFPLNIRRCFYSSQQFSPLPPTPLVNASARANPRARSKAIYPRTSRDITSTAAMSSATSFYDFKPLDSKHAPTYLPRARHEHHLTAALI